MTIHRAYVSLTQNELNMFQHFVTQLKPLARSSRLHILNFVDDTIFAGAYLMWCLGKCVCVCLCLYLLKAFVFSFGLSFVLKGKKKFLASERKSYMQTRWKIHTKFSLKIHNTTAKWFNAKNICQRHI